MSKKLFLYDTLSNDYLFIASKCQNTNLNIMWWRDNILVNDKILDFEQLILKYNYILNIFNYFKIIIINFSICNTL